MALGKLLGYHVVPAKIGFYLHLLAAHRHKLTTTLAHPQQQTELLHCDYQPSGLQ
jgi:hypothetical protein